jgi:penicillin-binding protein 1A
VCDEPISVATPAGRWEPRNYDRSFRGAVTLREALEQSLNVPFVRVGMEVGPERVAATARRLGIRSPLRAVPSLALGSSEVTLLELTRAYGVFATGGVLAPTRAVAARAVAGQPPRAAGPPDLHRVADAAEAYLVTSALEGVVVRGTGRGAGLRPAWGGVAGKSGTSNDWRDAWFVAYTPNLAVGVWVGHDDGRSLGLSGAQAALPIAARFVREALRLRPGGAFPMPDGVETAHVGRGAGGWFGWQCEGEPEVFLAGTAPRTDCWTAPDWDADEAGEWVDELARRAGALAERLAERLAEQSRRRLRH